MNEGPIQIGLLADHLETIPTIARWHHDEWHHLAPNVSQQARAGRLRQRALRGGLPCMFVATCEQTVIGTAALIACDMETHPEWSPWLASVYVAAPWRRQGAGRLLVRRVIDESQKLGHGRLFLFTPDRTRFYEHFGWQPILNEPYAGVSVTVMELLLNEIEANGERPVGLRADVSG